jgi:branched-chain amino acid transport system substrate-binding protein
VPNLSDFYQTVAASTFGDDPNPEVNEFFAKIEERTGKPADGSYAIFGYSIIQALKIAIEDAGTTDGEELKAALESFDGTELLIGPVTFTPEEHLDATRPEKVLEMQDGKVSFHSIVEPTEIPDPF